jgi:hypothetical protein
MVSTSFALPAICAYLNFISVFEGFYAPLSLDVMETYPHLNLSSTFTLNTMCEKTSSYGYKVFKTCPSGTYQSSYALGKFDADLFAAVRLDPEFSSLKSYVNEIVEGMLSSVNVDLCQQQYHNVTICSTCPAGSCCPSICHPSNHHCNTDNLTVVKEKCPAGYFCHEGSSNCHENFCSKNHYCPAGSAIQLPCPVNTYSHPGSSVCIPCVPDHYEGCSFTQYDQPVYGRRFVESPCSEDCSFQEHHCEACPLYTTYDLTSPQICVPCFPKHNSTTCNLDGHYGNTLTTTNCDDTIDVTPCSECPDKTYSNAGTNYTCSLCPPGTKFVNSTVECLCSPTVPDVNCTVGSLVLTMANPLNGNASLDITMGNKFSCVQNYNYYCSATGYNSASENVTCDTFGCVQTNGQTVHNLNLTISKCNGNDYHNGTLCVHCPLSYNTSINCAVCYQGLGDVINHSFTCSDNKDPIMTNVIIRNNNCKVCLLGSYNPSVNGTCQPCSGVVNVERTTCTRCNTTSTITELPCLAAVKGLNQTGGRYINNSFVCVNGTQFSVSTPNNTCSCPVNTHSVQYDTGYGCICNDGLMLSADNKSCVPCTSNTVTHPPCSTLGDNREFPNGTIFQNGVINTDNNYTCSNGNVTLTTTSDTSNCSCPSLSRLNPNNITCSCNPTFTLVNGICSCPQNASPINGTCQCLPNFSPNNNNGTCSCNSPFSIDVNGNCVCNSTLGLTSNNLGGCQCNPTLGLRFNGENACQCNFNLGFDPTSNILNCTCNTNYINNGTSCKCLYPFTVDSDYNCRCPDNTTSIGNTCTCSPTFTNSSGSCSCDSNARLSNMETCVCNLPFVMDVNGNCVCNSTLGFTSNNLGGCQCNPTLGLTSNGEGGCRCNSNLGFTNKNPSNPLNCTCGLNTNTSDCSCLSPYVRSDNGVDCNCPLIQSTLICNVGNNTVSVTLNGLGNYSSTNGIITFTVNVTRDNSNPPCGYSITENCFSDGSTTFTQTSNNVSALNNNIRLFPVQSCPPSTNQTVSCTGNSFVNTSVTYKIQTTFTCANGTINNSTLSFGLDKCCNSDAIYNISTKSCVSSCPPNIVPTATCMADSQIITNRISIANFNETTFNGTSVLVYSDNLILFDTPDSCNKAYAFACWAENYALQGEILTCNSTVCFNDKGSPISSTVNLNLTRCDSGMYSLPRGDFSSDSSKNDGIINGICKPCPRGLPSSDYRINDQCACVPGFTSTSTITSSCESANITRATPNASYTDHVNYRCVSNYIVADENININYRTCCQPPFGFDKRNMACICLALGTFFNGTDCQLCDSNLIPDDLTNTCVCPPGTLYNITGLKCEKCNDGSFLNGTKCQTCPLSTPPVVKSFSCFNLTIDGSLVPNLNSSANYTSNTTTTCDNGLLQSVDNTDYSTCCPRGTLFVNDGPDSACYCPLANNFFNGTGCQTCPNNLIVDTNTYNKCRCPNKFVLNNNNTCVCPSNKYLSPDNITCVKCNYTESSVDKPGCRKGFGGASSNITRFINCDGTKTILSNVQVESCTLCSNHTIIVNMTLPDCTSSYDCKRCPIDTYPNPNQNACIPCSSGKYLDYATGNCTATCPTVNVTNTDNTFNTTVLSLANNNTGVCECPTGTFRNTQETCSFFNNQLSSLYSYTSNKPPTCNGVCEITINRQCTYNKTPLSLSNGEIFYQPCIDLGLGLPTITRPCNITQ